MTLPLPAGAGWPCYLERRSMNTVQEVLVSTPAIAQPRTYLASHREASLAADAVLVLGGTAVITASSEKTASSTTICATTAEKLA